MKKAISIVLLICFAIYHFGYYAFYFSYESHLERQWVSQIYGEEVYGTSEILIEVPLSVPYMANQDDFQPTNTPFEKDGKYFRVVKQRYQNDTLQLIAVPDTARKVLDNTIKNWISFLTDDEIPQDKNGNISVQFFAKDYIQPNHYLFKAIDKFPLAVTLGDGFFHYSNTNEDIESPPPQFS